MMNILSSLFNTENGEALFDSVEIEHSFVFILLVFRRARIETDNLHTSAK